jgi:rod shape-determining protein MreD
MLLFTYFLAALALWIQATLYPNLPILPFAPFLSLACLVRPLNKTLLSSFLAGLAVDLVSSDPFGLHALTYCLAAALSFRVRKLFSAEIPLQYALFTALVSLVATLFQIILLFLFDRRVPFCGIWWLTDWATLPILDALYTLVWFAAPLALYRTLHRRWVIYWLKKKNPSLT